MIQEIISRIDREEKSRKEREFSALTVRRFFSERKKSEKREKETSQCQ